MAIKNRKIKLEEDFINEEIEKNSLQKNRNVSKRNFKTITIPLSKDEYNLLKKLAGEYEQSLNGIIRYALKQLQKTTK